MPRYLTLLACCILASPAANGGETDPSRFSLSLGGFFADRDTKIRLDGSGGRGTTTDLEEDLGLDRRSRVFRVDGYFRIKGPHRLDFSVFDLSRSKRTQIDETIEWGDESFPVSATIDTEFDLEIYKAAYTYEFRRSDTGFLGITGGLYVAETASRLVEPNLGQRDIRALTLPLPVLGLRGERALTERWTFRASGEFFFLQYDDYKGSLGDLYAVFDYALNDNVSLGLGANSVQLNVRARKTDFDGRLKWRYSGALAFVKFDF
jgi:hypothetical protein